MDVNDSDDNQKLTSDVTVTSGSAAVPSLPRDPTLDCAICLQPFVQPIQLPCSHTFCFLCAKGIALQQQPCALCRSDIPIDFLTKPGQFQAKRRSKAQVDDDTDKHVWYYQGHKGWWQYDERTSVEIEEAFIQEVDTVDILIAGAIYIIDFQGMVQYQRNMNSRKRKIKRDTIAAQKKGIAGMTSDKPGTSAISPPTQMVSRSSITSQVPVGNRNDPTGASQGSGDN